MNHAGNYRPGAQWIPWVHGFSDPDEMINEDLPAATRYLSIFGWEREFVRHENHGMKVWFHHARTRTSILFPYAYWREPNTLLIPVTIVRP